MNRALIEFRKSIDKTTEQMARKIGVSESYYLKIEYGQRNPSYNFISKFKRAFPKADIGIFFRK